MPVPNQRISDVLADVETIIVLVWLSDAILLVARCQGEADTRHLVVALGVMTSIAAAIVLVARRYRVAMSLMLLLTAAALWLVRFGPALHVRGLVFAGLAVIVGIVVVTWLRPTQLAASIPLLILAHQWFVTATVPAIVPLAIALVLTPLMPWLFVAVRSRPPALLTIGLLSVMGAIILVMALRQRVDSQTWVDRTRRGPATGGANVVLIVLDTLRDDRLGLMGYRVRDTTPFLDRFARRAVIFPRAYASSSWTIPSVASMFTGLSAGEHGVVTGQRALPRRRTTIAESLHRAGYFTCGISANFVLDKETGFSRGFERYTVLWRLIRGSRRPVPSIWDDINALLTTYYDGWHELLPDWNWKPHASAVVRRTIAEVDAAPGDRPLFLYVQFVDPHAPCDAGTYDDWKPSASDRPFDEKWSIAYDGEIRALDRALETLVGHIDRRLDPRRTLLVIVADHGEQLGEGGLRGHGINLSEATIRVPLLVRLPEGMSSTDPNAPFATAGIFDLLAGAANLPVPARDRAFVHSSLLVGNTFQRAVTDGTYKLIQYWQLRPARLTSESLYRLPDEYRNVLAANAAEASRLRAASESEPLPPATDADSMLNKLRALGYLR